MKKFGLILIVLFLVSLLTAESLSLTTARNLALKNNPDLLAQEEDTKASNNSLMKSYLKLIPSASINAGYNLTDDSNYRYISTVIENEVFTDTLTYDSSTNYGFRIDQPIFNGGKIWLGSRIANDSYKISKQTLSATTLSTIAEVESKYFTVLENKALLQIAEKDMEASNTNVETAKIRYETGSLSKAEYLQVQSENASKDVILIQRENMYRTSLLDLANFLQIDEVTELEDIAMENYNTSLEILKKSDLHKANEITENFVTQGEDNNPSLKISDLAVATSEKSRLMAGGDFLPSVNLSYSKNWSKVDYEDDYTEGNGTLGINFSMPIFPIVDNGFELAKANHNLKKAKYNNESAKDGIELSIKSSVLNLISAAKTVKSAELAKEFSSETYEQMQERFRNGLITANALLSAEVTFTTAQNQYTNSFYDYLRAKSALMQLIGSSDDELFSSLIK